MKRPLILIFICMIVFSVLSIHEDTPPPIDSCFVDQVSELCSGTVYAIIEKEKTTAVYLKNVSFDSVAYDTEHSKSYQVDRILMYNQDGGILQVGNRILVTGSLQKLSKGTNPGQFNEYIYYKGSGISYKLFAEDFQVKDSTYSYLHFGLRKLKNKIKTVFTTYLPEQDAGILNAMLLGDKTELAEDTKALYQKNGIAHILAISGLHISFIGLALYKLLKKIYIPNEMAVPVTLLVLFLYGTLTNFSVSTNRAVVMLAISLCGILLGRTYDFISAMCLSGTIILLQNPYQLLNCGFLLSFGAVFSIAVIFPVLKEIFLAEEEGSAVTMEKKSSKWNLLFFHSKMKQELLESPFQKAIRQLVKKAKESLLLSCSTNLMTLPIILYFYFDYPVYSIFLNLLILPLMTFLVAFGLILGIGGMFTPIIGYLFAGGCHAILTIYEFLCNVFLKIPYSILTIGRPRIWMLLLYYLCVGVFLLVWYKKACKWALVFCAGCFCVFISLPQTKLEITMMDVGQGDGILIQNRNQNTYLIDGGSTSVSGLEQYRLTPCLKSKGISTINYAILTHMDEDHISGIKELIEKSGEPGNITVQHLILPDTNLRDEAYLEMVDLAAKKQIAVIYFKKGDTLSDGALSFYCEHPYEGFETEERNDYSTVLCLKYKKFTMLFTGDVANEGEQALINSSTLGECDIYKAAHHGSQYTNSEELLNKVNPKVSLISAGKGNNPTTKMIQA